MVRIRMTVSMAVGTDRAVLLQRFRVAPYFVLASEIEQVWWCGAVEALEDAVGLRACDLDPQNPAKIEAGVLDSRCRSGTVARLCGRKVRGLSPADC